MPHHRVDICRMEKKLIFRWRICLNVHLVEFAISAGGGFVAGGGFCTKFPSLFNVIFFTCWACYTMN